MSLIPILLSNFYDIFVIDMLKINNYASSRHISRTKNISILKDVDKKNGNKYCWKYTGFKERNSLLSKYIVRIRKKKFRIHITSKADNRKKKKIM